MRTLGIAIAAVIISAVALWTPSYGESSLGTITGITVGDNPIIFTQFLEEENPDGKQVGWNPIPEARWMILKVRHKGNLGIEYEKPFSAWSCCGDWQINAKIIHKADIDLIEDREYVYRLEAYDDEWNMIARGARTVKHDVQPDTHILIHKEGPNGVKLYWDGYDGVPSKLEGYRIMWRKRDGGSWNQAVNLGHYADNTSDQAKTYKVIGWVERDAEYVYRIEAMLVGQRDFLYGTTTYTLED